MSLQWIEGWELVKTSAAFSRLYESVSGPSPTFPAGRQFGTALLGPGTGTTSTEWTTPARPAHATWIVGDAHKWKTLLSGSGEGPILALVDDATEQLSLHIALGGAGGAEIKLQVYRGGAGGTLLGETDFILQLDTYYYIELKATINNTTGSYEVRVNEQTRLSATGVDTQVSANASADRIRKWARVGDFDDGHFIDDGYAANGEAGNVTDFIGDRVVSAKRPNSDASPNQWDPVSGVDNFAMVDDDDPDDDSTYNTSTTSAQKDMFGFEDISDIDNDDIAGVMMKLLPRLTLAGSRDIKTKYKQGVTEVDGETHTVDDTAYSYKTEIQERDPTDDAAWTRAKIDSLEAGVESV